MSIQLRSILSGYTSNTYYLPINLADKTGQNTFINFYSANLSFLPSNNTLFSYNVRATGTGFIFPDGTVQTTSSTNFVEPSLGISGTYGNTSYVPVVTVAANGRIIAVTNTIISTTLAQASFNQANGSYNQANTANTLAQASFNQANGAFTQANTANTLAQASFNQANGAFTQANTANTLAQSAYNQANGAFDQANTANTLAQASFNQANGAFTKANTANTLAQASFNQANGAYNQANTANTLAQASFNQANGAFIQANTANTLAQASFNQANGAYNQANTANTLAQSGFNQANGAYNQANTANTLAQSGFNQANGAFTQANTANTLAQASFNQANGSYNQANTANTLAQSGFNQANGAFTKANTANTLAQSAYDQANTKLSSSGGTISGSLTIQNNLTVQGNVSYTGNVTSITITGNTGQFFGYTSNGFNALYAGIPVGYFLEPQISFQISSNYNGYSGLNMQNINTGANASSDLFITSDNGTINDGFLDLGFASSTYAYTGYTLIGKNDGYLFATGNTTTGGGNMIVGTGLNNDVIFSVGGINTENEIARFKYNTGLVLKQFPIKFADNTSQNTAAAPFAFSNASFTQANTANTLAQSGFNQANGAYNQANTANTLAQSGFNQANGAFTQANTATIIAQAAFDKANTVSSTTLPLILNDISSQFTGSQSVFTLFTDQTNITSSDVVDSRNMEVIVNGLRLAPYIKQNTYPWLTPYDSFIGFRVVSDANTANLIIYNSPAPTDQAIVTIINKATNVQTRKYPYSATTIALGD